MEKWSPVFCVLVYFFLLDYLLFYFNTFQFQLLISLLTDKLLFLFLIFIVEFVDSKFYLF